MSDIVASTRRPVLAVFDMHRNKGMIEIGVLQSQNPVMRLRVLSLEGARRSGLLERPSTPEWALLDAIRSFVGQPNVEHLAAHVASLADADTLDAAERVISPWVVSTATNLVSGGMDPHDLSRRIAAGCFGKTEDWSKAEQRWQSNGLVDEDLAIWANGDFFGADVAERGAPYSAHLTRSVGRGASWSDELAKLVAVLSVALPSGPAEQIRHIVSFALREPNLGFSMDVTELVRAAYPESDKRRLFGTEPAAALTPDARLDPILLARLAEIGRERRFFVGSENVAFEVASVLAMVRASGDHGILAFGCATFASSSSHLRELACALAVEGGPVMDVETASPSYRVLDFAAGKVGAREIVNAGLFDVEETMEQHALLALAMDGRTDGQDAETLLAGLLERSGIDHGDMREEALAALAGLLDQRGSGMDEIRTWLRLGLPSRLHAMLRPDAPAAI